METLSKASRQLAQLDGITPADAVNRIVEAGIVALKIAERMKILEAEEAAKAAEKAASASDEDADE